MAVTKIRIYDENGDFLRPDQFRIYIKKSRIIETGIRKKYKDALSSVFKGIFHKKSTPKTIVFTERNDKKALKGDWYRIGRDLNKAIITFRNNTKKLSESR